MSTRQDEWALVAQRASVAADMAAADAAEDTEEQIHQNQQQQKQLVVPAFGVHPWFVEEEEDAAVEGHFEWEANLRQWLLQCPQAIVGECGLDKVYRPPRLEGVGEDVADPDDADDDNVDELASDGTTDDGTGRGLGTDRSKQRRRRRRRKPGATVDWGLQVECVERQLRLAAELRRPVSMHCVKGHGKLCEVLDRMLRAAPPHSTAARPGFDRPQGHVAIEAAAATATATATAGGGDVERKSYDDEGVDYHGQADDGEEDDDIDSEDEKQGEDDGLLPPTLALHSCTASVDMMRHMFRPETPLAARLFVGFSHSVNLKSAATTDKMRALLLHVPPERVLLESDLHTRHDQARALQAVAEVVADVWGVGVDTVKQQTLRNALAFLRPVLQSAGTPIPARITTTLATTVAVAAAGAAVS